MGMRAIRICLTCVDLFKTQLRALLRASAYGKIAIMFPMIISVWEVQRCKEILNEVRQELDEKGIAYDKDMEIGIMVETPAAAVMSEELAKEVDFFSIGSNDLTQYTLAIDRQQTQLDAFFDPHHPAVHRKWPQSRHLGRHLRRTRCRPDTDRNVPAHGRRRTLRQPTVGPAAP